MSAPNINTAVTVTGKSSMLALTASNQNLLANAASSGQVWRIASLYASNVTTANASVTLYLCKAGAAASAANLWLNSVVIPANCCLVVCDKTSPMYLEENDSIVAVSTASSLVTACAAYELISIT